MVKVDVKHETTPSGAYLRGLFSSLDRESTGARYLVLYRKLQFFKYAFISGLTMFK